MPDREELYKKCDIRVDKMFDDGLYDEAISVYEKVKSVKGDFDLKDVTSLMAIGYREFLPPGIRTAEEAKALIKLSTRHYAKRQITWFKKTPGCIYFDI